MKINRRILLEVLDIVMFITGLVIVQLFGIGDSAIEIMVTFLGVGLIRGASCIDKRPYNELDEIKINPNVIDYIMKNAEFKKDEKGLIEHDIELRKIVRYLLKLERNYYKNGNEQENKDC